MAGERSVKIKFIADKIAKFVAETKTAGGAIERFGTQADKASSAAGRFGGALKSVLAPGAPAAIAALSVPVIGLAASLGGAGAALGTFGAVLTSSQKQITENATKFTDLNDKIALYGREAELAGKRGLDGAKFLEKQAKAALELEARLSLLPVAEREATRQYLGMQRAWQKFVEANSPTTFGILGRGYGLIRKNLDKLQPLYDIGAAAAKRALTALERFAGGGGLDRFVAFLSAKAEPAIASFGTILSNVGKFLGSLFSRTADDGQGFLDLLTRASEKLAAFGENGGLDRFLDTITSNGPGAGAALVSIATAAVHIAQATAPLAPISLAVAAALAQLIAAVPPQVITALVGAWVAYRVAIGVWTPVATIATTVTKILTAEKLKNAIASARAAIAERASAAATAAGNAGRAVAAGAVRAWTAATNLLTLANIRTAAATVASTVATVAANVAQKAIAIGLKAWAAAQWLVNIAMTANPIGLIIAGIVALIAIIVLIATKTTWFQTIWKVVWGAIQSAAKFVADWFMNTLVPSFKRALDQLVAVINFVVGIYKGAFNILVAAVKFVYNAYVNYIKLIISAIRLLIQGVLVVVNYVRDRWNAMVSLIAGLGGRIRSAARGIWDGIKDSFRSAINYIIDKWNGLSFSLPSINTPFGKIGGTTLSTPNLPRLASGGWAQPGRTYLAGENGPELLTTGRRAYVNNAGATEDMMSTPPVVHVYIGDRELTDIVDVRIETNNRGTRRRVGARVGAYA
jgi:phage-related protein